MQLDRRQGQCCNSALPNVAHNSCDYNKNQVEKGFVGYVWKDENDWSIFEDEMNKWRCEQKCKDTSEDLVACMYGGNSCYLYTREQFGNQISGGNYDEYFTCWLRKGI